MAVAAKPAAGGPPPGPRGYPLVGVLPQIRRDPLDYFRAAVRDYGDVVRLPLLGESITVVNHPTEIREILQLHHQHYLRSRFHDRLKPVLGDGLVTSEGPLWEDQRALMQPYFHRRRLRELVPLMAETISARAAALLPPGERSAVVEVEKAMLELTLDVFCTMIFEHRLSPQQVQRIGDLLGGILRAHSPRLWLQRRLVGMLTRGRDHVQTLVDELDEIVAELISARRAQNSEEDNLLNVLIAQLDRGVDYQLLRDQIVTLLFAGHETTTAALSWTLYLLASHPDVQEQVRAEATACPDLTALDNLTYTGQVINEAMRLYPPVWRMTRRADGDRELGGCAIAANSTIVLCQYTTHRDARWWPSPDRFDPDRFAKDTKVDNFAYYPFSRGPRTCLGLHLAMMEMQMVVAHLAQTYALEMADVPVRPKAFFSLRTEDGIWLRLTRRR